MNLFACVSDGRDRLHAFFRILVFCPPGAIDDKKKVAYNASCPEVWQGVCCTKSAAYWDKLMHASKQLDNLVASGAMDCPVGILV